MKTLLIVGAGGLGRETYQWVLDQQKADKRWYDIGFLDDNPHALDNYRLSAKIVGTVKAYEPRAGEEVICAIGDAEVIADICPVLVDKGAVFATVIHPTALLADTCEIGKGVIVGPYAIISTDAKISDFSVVNSYVSVGHDVSVGKGCVISGFSDLMGFSALEEGVFLGSGARLLPSVRVAANAKVGAGSIVLKNVKANTTVFGNPAKIISAP